MSDVAERLYDENEDLKKEIKKVKGEILNISDDVDVESLSPEMFEILDTDEPKVASIKKQIINKINLRNKLRSDLVSIQQTASELSKDIDFSQFKTREEMEAALKNADYETEIIENDVFTKLAAVQYQINKVSNPRLKTLLQENYDVHISKIRMIEELRLKRQQLAAIRTLPIGPETHEEEDHEEDDKKRLETLQQKLNMTLNTQNKLLDLKLQKAKISYLKSLPEQQTDPEKFKKIDEKIKKLDSRIKSYHDAKNKGPEEYQTFLQNLRNGKKRLAAKQQDFYKMKIALYDKQIKLYQLEYETGTKTKEETIQSVKTLMSHMKRFKKEIESAEIQVSSMAKRLNDENQLFQQAKSEGQSVDSVYEEIARLNDQYQNDIQNFRMMKLTQIAEVNKICTMLKIPPLQVGEDLQTLFERMSKEIKILKNHRKDRPASAQDIIDKYDSETQALASSASATPTLPAPSTPEVPS